jgi:hypothetical protein
LGVQAQGPRIDVAESLEQRGLSFHDRQGGFGTKIAQAEYSGPVCDDRNTVPLAGQPASVLLVSRDRQRDTGHPRGVKHGQIVTVADWVLARHRDLAAQMHQEGAIADLVDHNARHAAHRFDESLSVLGVTCGTRYVDSQPFLSGGRDIERSDRTAGLFNGGRQLADRRSPRRNLQPHSDGVRNGGKSCHAADLLTAVSAIRC